MTVYVFEGYMLADTVDEAREFAKRLLVPQDRLRLAGTPRWYYAITDEDRAWAVTMGAKPVDLDAVRALVAIRSTTPRAVPVPADDGLGDPPARTPEPERVRPRRRYNPTLRRHYWEKVEEHHARCVWCGLATVNQPVPKSGRWFRTWVWPRPLRDGQVDGDTLDGARVPSCPGPV